MGLRRNPGREALPSDSVMQWLLESSDPSVRYRTLAELLGKPLTASEVVTAQQAISSWDAMRDILRHMTPDGCWVTAGKRRSYGRGLEYYGSATTPHVLHNLAELGLTRAHPQVHKAASRYLALLDREFDFRTLQSCIHGYMLRAFAMMGYADHPVFARMTDLVLGSIRWDNGYQCGREKKTRPVKSCMRGTWQVLMAFAEVPALRQSPVVQRLVRYFLDRNVLFRRDTPDKVLRPEVTATIFPFTHGRASLLEPLYALSKMGHGRHPALNRAWEMLEQKKTADGRYILNWAPATLFPAAKRGEPNKWVTLYAALAHKYRDGIGAW
jgi:hypothetical protein